MFRKPKGIGTCPRNTLNGEGKRGDRFEICPQIIQMGVFQHVCQKLTSSFFVTLSAIQWGSHHSRGSTNWPWTATPKWR